MKQKLRYQRKTSQPASHVEFGSELTGDMNTSKIYEALNSSNTKRSEEKQNN
ncbi:hypothetical protein V1498_15635 [Peribacillus sp. SCS-26]|uniref:hypothetical protein n=1 Tax=Paraperibacillus marinus TaxID=3115295 RepID=UPI003905A23D